MEEFFEFIPIDVNFFTEIYFSLIFQIHHKESCPNIALSAGIQANVLWQFNVNN